jgi:hypothetical protein
LQSDSRLDSLDAAISTRATEANLNSIKGAGFNPATDTLENIKDAVMTGLDTSSILADLGQIKGVGFNSAQHSLKQISDKTEAAKLSADNASANAASAYAEASTKASQASLDVLAGEVSLIPTDTVLETDFRLDRLNASVDSRLSAVEFEQILGGTFNPATDNLSEIRDSIDVIRCGDATIMNQEEILNLISDLSSQVSVNALADSIAAIPTTPVLQSDARIARLDVAVSSRASQAFVQSMAGSGFDPVTDSLEQIKDSIPPEVDSITIMNELARIQGSGFEDEVDDLHHINEVAKAERGQIQTDIDALLSSGSGV